MNYEKIANKYKVKPSIVKDEYEKFWKTVKKELAHPSKLKVSIPYFGVFLVQEGKLKNKIKQINKALLFYEDREGNVRDEKFKEDYLKQLKSACHLYENYSTEQTEVCEICLRWLNPPTIPS